MQAAVLYETNKPLIIEDSIVVPILQTGQVLVRVAYSGVCQSQLMEARGFRGKDKFLPHLLGHEGSGRVLAVGENVHKIIPGDYVILGWIKGDGIEAGGTQYFKDEMTINAGPVTTFNDYAVVSENRCVKLPEGIPLDIATLFGCAIPTGAGIIFNEIQLQPENSIAVFGLGGVGLSALMATKLFDNQIVIAVDINSSKLQLAKEFGATHVINSSQEDPVQRIMDITKRKGVDYSIEAAGHTKTIEQAFQVVRDNGGLCVFASHPKNGETIQLDPHALIRGKQIKGTWGGAVQPDRDIPRFAELYRKGKLPLEKLLSHRYSLENINEALNDLENHKIFRALIEIDPTI